MPLAAVAARRSIVTEAGALRLRAIRDEADAIEVVHVVTTPKHGRTLIRPVQQIAQRRNAAVMKIRRAQPNTVEWHSGITGRLSEVRELPRLALPDRIHPDREFGCER